MNSGNGPSPTPLGSARHPATRPSDTVDSLHGESVADPYRWLEDTESPETRDWIALQNGVSSDWLASVSTRGEIGERLTALWDYPKRGAPFERGGQWFQWRQRGLANQPVLHTMHAPEGEGHVLLDPNELSADGTVAITGIQLTEAGDLLAYALSSAGSDWMTWRVRSTRTGRDLSDVVVWSKFCDVAWRGDGSGFFYAAPERPAAGREYLSENRLLRIFHHQLGTDQGLDELVYERPDDPELIPEAVVSHDGRWLVITVHRGTRTHSEIHVLDLERPGCAVMPVIADMASSNEVVSVEAGTLYFRTDRGADHGRVVAVPIATPQEANWREVIPESDDTLVDVSHHGDRLVAHYLRHAQSRLVATRLDGTSPVDIPLPGGRHVTEITGCHDSPVIHMSISGFVDSGSLWRHDLESGATEMIWPGAAAVEADGYRTEQVFVPSDDGTQVPMFLICRADLTPNGDRPVLMYGYGGFNIPVTPSFDVAWVVWLERGGVLAVANLRGGGEYGSAWHDAGRRAHKQTVFDDFCACARWLHSSGWSRPERIAINGRSNGGLLVGACLTQHPELFGAAVPEVGVLDMLRFHRFTVGWAWTSDYGDPDLPDEYSWLRAYSPLHNVRRGRYPATLILTGDHDDRVVPGHSFKFAATLQAAQTADAAILIRVETSAGHGVGRPTEKVIAERTDLLAFLDATVCRQLEPTSG